MWHIARDSNGRTKMLLLLLRNAGFEELLLSSPMSVCGLLWVVIGFGF
jgi:hypothetical protein